MMNPFFLYKGYEYLNHCWFDQLLQKKQKHIRIYPELIYISCCKYVLILIYKSQSTI